MKNLKTILVSMALLAGIGASADCCVSAKCVKTVTKCVPQKVCSTVCVPTYDSCGNFCGYKKVKRCVTKYKTVKQKVTVDCCCCN